MFLHVARRRLPFISQKPRGRTFLPAFALSTTATLRTLANPSNELTRAQISRASSTELRSQLSTRNLPTGGNKPELIDRLARSLSDSAPRLRAAVVNTIKHTEAGEARSPEVEAELKARGTRHEGGNVRAGIQETETPRSGRRHQHSHPEDVPELPSREELTPKEEEPPIRVPLMPDNKFARYHRHEVVPEVAKPLKPQVSTVLPDAFEVLHEHEGDLAKVLEKISVEVKAHRNQVLGNDDKAKETVKGLVNDMAGGMKNMRSKNSNSTLYMMARLPVDLVKDMVDDVVSAGKQFVEKEKRERAKKEEKERMEDTGPQVLTAQERTVMYTIGGLSAAWYFLGY